MTTPWPAPDSDTQLVMCCLCFGTKTTDALSKNSEGDLTDVCKECRTKELAAQKYSKVYEMVLESLIKAQAWSPSEYDRPNGLVSLAVSTARKIVALDQGENS